MNAAAGDRLFHRIAISTIPVALVTAVFGALTTTKDAGMAFPRWLYSDQYPMPLYPWLQDFGRNWNKFLEHGHRLSGMLIGMWVIGLVVAAWRLESRTWVRRLCVAVLIGVICQGVLGGLRVEQNNRSLAMLHGIFASIVFSLMGTVVVATSSYWPQKSSVRPGATDLRPWAFVTIASLVLQYVLGGLIRHLGTGLHEHLGMAVIVTLIVAANTYVCWRHGQPWVARSASWLAAIVLAQVLLGLGTWVYKFGLPSYGVVPVMNSFEQIVFRTSHAVLGILVMMTACMHAVRVLRTASSPQPAATGISNVMNSSLAGGAS